MQPTPKPSFFIKPSFLDKDSANNPGISLAAFAIVVLLFIAFVWYDAASLLPSHPFTGKDNQGVINQTEEDHGTVNFDENDQAKLNQDLVIAVHSALPKIPFQFICDASARSAFHLTAALRPDNTMWRYTNDGWRDISMMADPPPANKPIIEGVHPLIWTLMLLLASLLLLIMASSDDEIRKLFRRCRIGEIKR